MFPFVKESDLTALKNEYPRYKAAAEDVSHDYAPLNFWEAHSNALPVLAEAAKKILLIQPSSSAAVRVFSLMKNLFGDQQQSSLEDYIETSLMLQYNKNPQ